MFCFNTWWLDETCKTILSIPLRLIQLQTCLTAENLELCVGKRTLIFYWPAACPVSEKSKPSSQSADNMVYLTFTAVFPRMNAHGLWWNAKIFHFSPNSTHWDFRETALNLPILFPFSDLYFLQKTACLTLHLWAPTKTMGLTSCWNGRFVEQGSWEGVKTAEQGPSWGCFP